MVRQLQPWHIALEQVLNIARPDEAYFWATHQGAELDLLMLRGQQRIGVEFKRADAPTITDTSSINTNCRLAF
jgi:uncharacterized protein